MDTPTIAKYYREKDPMERLKLLEQSIAAGEDTEGNAIRKELWDIRYSAVSEMDVLTDIWDCGCPWNTTGMQAGDSLA